MKHDPDLQRVLDCPHEFTLPWYGPALLALVAKLTAERDELSWMLTWTTKERDVLAEKLARILKAEEPRLWPR